VETLKAERAAGKGVLLITHLLPANLEADRIVELQPAFEFGGQGEGGPQD